ncbi:carbohydrate sulfotransferase 15-like [Entelurus aequoreus]|uniref:carbohydrate sulfotransferase 15-like n=1 Tax=Entelurus aequoreus TaxID=161455 RepID=UPI002B1DDCB3|nr:carbohydrate sulfotransferase 15-like [Entelurus aequoreus]XP_061910779.1 carbohydrate sulfotransferase 15-like [Entelurus aequoreus]XP_061910780.1 carbohydrate sulfotransferase 15-like [Entelurus aequoreus]XP_061910781.1 carbohydrate sulfotransferase 15-like [Entelurus aequoreus]XP_061910782.1 carbohydrate sulfotransferase 15-like [Entelurus aequoreus]XP_061910783.1 carbohydrate sulfotransferase 15-like [Entelurus aequoreus]XP_061910785.1 carbohydrate sulfotransferase 15-like [Entelurus a
MTRVDYKYTLLGSPPDDYCQRPLLLQVDEALVNLFTILEVKRERPRTWRALGGAPKVRFYGLLFGVAVMFLVMASYVLTGDKKGLLLTPSPYHIGGLVSPGPFAFNVSAVKDYAHMQLVVKSIESKVVFTGWRQIPERTALVQSEQHMFSVIPGKFLPDVRNPCWYEEYAGNVTSDPYGENLYAHYARRFLTVFTHLRRTFEKHLFSHGGKLYRIRCLPYFYIIGQPKCGTTDLYNRLLLHPDVKFTTFKEPHWWTRKRFGIIRSNEGFHSRYPVEDYLDLLDEAAYFIQGNLTANDSGAPERPNVIIGEASASTMWDNNAWVYFYGNSTNGEPPFLIQDFVHAVQPDARFIVMLRDPVERLYSDYLYFGISNKSVEDFHEKVSESLQLFDGCLSDYTIRSCVYNDTLNDAMPVRLQVGLYVVYMLDWLSVFSREQILVLRLEDHASNRQYTMHQIFQFLDLGPLTKQMESMITRSPASNTRRPADKNLGPMLANTKDVLRQFYMPFNQKLAKVLHSDLFLWDSKP